MAGWPFRLAPTARTRTRSPAATTSCDRGPPRGLRQLPLHDERRAAAARAERVPARERRRPDRATSSSAATRTVARRRPCDPQAPLGRGGRPVGPVPAPAAKLPAPPGCARIAPCRSRFPKLTAWSSACFGARRRAPLRGGRWRCWRVTAVLALAGAALALRLEPSAATDTLVDRGSDTLRGHRGLQAGLRRRGGRRARARATSSSTVLTADLGRADPARGLPVGNVPTPGGPRELPPVCRELAQLQPGARSSTGPGTFVNTAANQIGEQFTREQQQSAAARRSARREAARQALEAPRRLRRPSRSGSRSAAADAGAAPSSQRDAPARRCATGSAACRASTTRASSRRSCSTGRAGEPGSPKARFAYLFPSENAALIQIRLRPDLTDAERERAIDLIQDGGRARRQFRPTRGGRVLRDRRAGGRRRRSPTRSRTRSSCCWWRRCS